MAPCALARSSTRVLPQVSPRGDTQRGRARGGFPEPRRELNKPGRTSGKEGGGEGAGGSLKAVNSGWSTDPWLLPGCPGEDAAAPSLSPATHRQALTHAARKRSLTPEMVVVCYVRTCVRACGRCSPVPGLLARHVILSLSRSPLPHRPLNCNPAPRPRPCCTTQHDTWVIKTKIGVNRHCPQSGDGHVTAAIRWKVGRVRTRREPVWCLVSGTQRRAF